MMSVTGRNHRVHVRVVECMCSWRRMEALEGRETINEKDIGKWEMVSGGRQSQGTSVSQNQMRRWMNRHRSTIVHCSPIRRLQRAKMRENVRIQRSQESG